MSERRRGLLRNPGSSWTAIRARLDAEGESHPDRVYWELTLAYGLKALEAVVEWGEEAEATLSRLAETGERPRGSTSSVPPGRGDGGDRRKAMQVPPDRRHDPGGHGADSSLRPADRASRHASCHAGNPCRADYVPPPPEYLDELLADLCAAINDDRHSPVVQAALVHAQFETIHPFDDGNGRTGRALIHVVLRRRGLAPSYVPPISVALANSRDRYIRGLVSFRGTEVVEWIERFAASAAAAARLASAYLEAVRALESEWKAKLSGRPGAPRADAAAWAVIEALPAHPVITASAAVAATGRASSQVYAAMNQLGEAGVLIPLSDRRRNRSWEAAGLLELVAGLEAGATP